MSANNLAEVDPRQFEAAVDKMLKSLSEGGTIGDVLNMNPDDLEGVYAVAYSFMTAGKYDKAMPLLRFLCLYDHTEPRWSYALGIAWQKNGEYQKAIQAYLVATLLDCYDPRPQAQAGFCLMQMRSFPEAVSALEGAEMVCGDDQPKLRAQIQAMLSQARLDAAKEGEDGQ